MQTPWRMYLPLEGSDASRCALILHSRSDPELLTRNVAGAASGIGETVSAFMLACDLPAKIFLRVYREITLVIGSVGAVATTLAAVGMFALVAFTVAQRTREIGIRTALGARPAHILGVLFKQNIKPTAFGVLAGVLLAAIVSHSVSEFGSLRRARPRSTLSTRPVSPPGWLDLPWSQYSRLYRRPSAPYASIPPRRCAKNRCRFRQPAVFDSPATLKPLQPGYRRSRVSASPTKNSPARPGGRRRRNAILGL